MKNCEAERGSTALIAGLSLLSVPVVVDLAVSGKNTPFRYFAADAFYAFTIARNFAETGIPSFDQIYPTNGFHPIWELLLGCLYKVCIRAGFAETVFLFLVVLVSVVFVSLGVLFIGRAFMKCCGGLPSSFALFPVGIYALAILPIWIYSTDVIGYKNPFEGPLPLYGTMWSFINGVESPLAIFFFGLLTLMFIQYQKATLGRCAVMGLVAGLLVLSRLDQVFIALPCALGFVIAVKSEGKGKFFAKSALFCVFCLVPIMVYLVINYAYAGSMMPVSGAAKTTFPMPTKENLYYLHVVLTRPFLDEFWLDMFYRQAQMILPACVAVFFCIWVLFRKSAVKNGIIDRILTLNAMEYFLLVTSVGVVCLAGYNFFFVRWNGPGHWYFPVSILHTTIIFLYIFQKAKNCRLPYTWKLAGCIALCLLVFFAFHRREQYHNRYAKFYFEEAEKIREFYKEYIPKIIENDDGIIAFSTGFPCMTGFGLALDREAFQYWKKGRLVELALERGFDRVASLVYKNYSGVKGEKKVDYIPNEPIDYSPEYVSEDGSFGIAKIISPQKKAISVSVLPKSNQNNEDRLR